MTREEALNKIGELVVYARAQGWDEEFTEAFETLSAKHCREADDYENEIADLHNRLNIAECGKEMLRKEATVREEKLKALSAEPCEDAISRAAAIKAMDDLEQEDIERYSCSIPEGFDGKRAIEALQSLPSVTPKQKMGRCKDCKYFEYDSVAKVDGIPLIVAHEICSRWGDGCKTREDGYCFLYEPQEGEEKK